MSAQYKLLANGYVERGIDGANIPPVATNADWQDYQAWLAAGNVPDPVETPVPESPP